MINSKTDFDEDRAFIGSGIFVASCIAHFNTEDMPSIG